MDPELEASAKRAADPRLISGIYNYCHRWCERCQFTERCLTFRDMRQYEAEHPGADVFEHVHDSFQKTFALLQAWCEREGIDFGQLRQEANSEESTADLRRLDDAILADPLQKLARAYSQAAFELIKSLEKARLLHVWPRAIHEAIDTISWYSGMVSAKVHRALHGFAERDDDLDSDAVQNDWNGSAKVARLAVSESKKAWETILTIGKTAADSPVRQVIDLLNQIDSGLDERFPRAMEFVRPGFDEPEVAAGALTSLAPFDPRQR